MLRYAARQAKRRKKTMARAALSRRTAPYAATNSARPINKQTQVQPASVLEHDSAIDISLHMLT